jgi:hypothetical protein
LDGKTQKNKPNNSGRKKQLQQHKRFIAKLFGKTIWLTQDKE